MKYSVKWAIPAIAFHAALAQGALAADLNTGNEPALVQPQFQSGGSASLWNGAYAGLYGGLNWSKVGVMGAPDIGPDHGMEGGAYIGFNQALGDNIVGGVEIQGGYGGLSDSFGGISAKQDWEASLRGRMGYAVEQNLIYGLAGVSASRLNLKDATGSDANWLTGWTVGAGVERQLTDMITGRVEYDYSKYGSERFNLGATNPKADLTGHGVKIGLGVKFRRPPSGVATGRRK